MVSVDRVRDERCVEESTGVSQLLNIFALHEVLVKLQPHLVSQLLRHYVNQFALEEVPEIVYNQLDHR